MSYYRSALTALNLKIALFLMTVLSLSTVNVFCQHTYVFCGSYFTNQWDSLTEGIYIYELDIETGKLTEVSTVKGIRNPSYLTASPDKKFIYACTDAKTPGSGSVSSFQFDPATRTLRFLNKQSSGGENPAYVAVDRTGKWLVNANYTQGSLAVHPVRKDGKLDSMVQNFLFTDRSVHPERQDRSHVHAAIFAPDFDYIFFPDLGADKLRGYAFNPNSRTPLTETKSYAISAGGGPRHMRFHPNKKFAYAIEEMAGMITVFRYNRGQLDSIQRVPTHPAELTQGFESSDLQLSPDGFFLYATNRGKENNIAIFSVKADGTLRNLGYQSTYGTHPRNFSLDPSGNYLIVANVLTQNIVVFRRDLKTGLLQKTDEAKARTDVSSVLIANYP